MARRIWWPWLAAFSTIPAGVGMPPIGSAPARIVRRNIAGPGRRCGRRGAMGEVPADQLPPAGEPRQAALVFIFITVLLDMLALGIIIPVWPRLVVGLLSGDSARGAEIFGVFGTAWALMQFVFSPIQGALSDRFGRRPVILLSNLGEGLDYFVMALAPSLGWLLVGRVVSGATAASVSTAFAYIADVTPPEKRAGRFGMVGAAFGIGFVLGPAIGGLLGE